MAWVKIDDNFPQHPKVARVGPLAMALQVAGLCYCNRNLTDGFLPRAVARTLLDWEVVDSEGTVHALARTTGMAGNDVTSEWVIQQLLDAGIWVEEPLGYRIHDYLDYQPAAADVHRQREKTKTRVNQWRSKHRGEDSEKCNGVTNAVINGNGNGHVTGAPVPDPVPEERVEGTQPSAAPALWAMQSKTREARGKRLDVDALPDDWRGFCRDHRPDLDPSATFARFRDYWIAQPGQRGVKRDWAATWRNWVRTEKSPSAPAKAKPDWKKY